MRQKKFEMVKGNLHIHTHVENDGRETRNDFDNDHS